VEKNNDIIEKNNNFLSVLSSYKSYSNLFLMLDCFTLPKMMVLAQMQEKNNYNIKWPILQIPTSPHFVYLELQVLSCRLQDVYILLIIHLSH
jgi:hypothetical protein